MAIRRGLQKVKEIKETQSSGGGNHGLRFVIFAGETAIVRFYGDFEGQNMPILAVTHYGHHLPRGQQYHNCTSNLENSDVPCVFCHVIDKMGNKDIKRQNRAYFWLKDFRKIHKLENEVQILKPGVPFVPGKRYAAEDYTKTKYVPCSAPKRICSYCNQGGPPQINGYRHWELANQYADMLVSQQAAIRDNCRCGAKDEEGNGTIQVVQYICGNQNVQWADGSVSPCGQPVDFDPNQGRPVAFCGTCNQTLPPLEEIGCTHCENPERCDLQDFLFKVTRTGDKKDTVYNFEPLQFKPPTAEELAEAQAAEPNWEEMLAPEPPELQASYLGIPSPFHTPGHGAQEYTQAAPRPVAQRPTAPQAPRLGGPPTVPPRTVAPPVQRVQIGTPRLQAPKPLTPPKLGAPKMLSAPPRGTAAAPRLLGRGNMFQQPSQDDNVDYE